MKFEKYKKVLNIILFPLIVFAVHELVNMPLGLYEIFPYMDLVMHFLGGFSIGAGAFVWLRQMEAELKIKNAGAFFFFAWTLGLTSFVAVLWEFYEFLSDSFLRTVMQLSLVDTMGDLFFGLSGGLAAGILIAILFKRIKD